MTLTRRMPPFRGIMAVDAVGFSRNRSSDLPDLSASIPDLLARTFERCGLAEIWTTRRFPQGTGDGYLFGVAHDDAPYLIAPLLDELQTVLEEQNQVLQAKSRDLRLRLRVAVHLGSVPDQGDAHDGIGTPTNDTFRLLDSDVIRQALKDSNPDITLLAAIVSQRVFEEVVRAGYTSDLHPDRFEHVIAEVAGKDFAQPAWIYVPKRSQMSVTPTPTSEVPSPPAAPPADAGGTTIHGNVGNSFSGGSVGGNVQQNGGNWPS
jgi:hypothetical protein